jgi:rhodanese-related sulfurtransferase
MPRSIAEVLSEARRGIVRIEAEDLPRLLRDGAWVIDLRTPWTRDPEGHIPGAVVIEHTVMLWRMDPRSPSRLDDGPGYEDLIITVCNEGYSSSLAARDLRELGFSRATDLVGGFRAWAEAGLPVQASPTRLVT